MGQIGKWIDERCREEPEVMRRVLKRKFGNLAKFEENDGKCGCLVGSWRLESGHYVPEYQAEGNAVWALCHRGRVVAAFDRGERSSYGHRSRKYTQPFLVRLLKQRIRKALGLAPAKVGNPIEEEVAV